MLASACLAVYVQPGQAPEGINQQHPRWLGAWWIGFIVIAALLMTFSPWLTLFPSRFDTKETDAARIEKSNSQDEPQTFKEWLEEAKGVAKRLLTSKVYMLNNISSALLLFGFMGFALFMPKFIEFHFRKTASSSGATGGIPKTLASVIGMLGMSHSRLEYFC